MLTKPASAQQTLTDSVIRFAGKNHQEQLYKVTRLSYEVLDKSLLAVLQTDQPNSLVSEGKTVNPSTFIKERNRIFLLLSPKNFALKIKDIGFTVDTTQQKGACTVVTIVRSADNY
ncbi:MAG: hypothetical protein ACRYFB_02595 [Janthinobacterium lividum]